MHLFTKQQTGSSPLRVARVTADLVESNGSLLLGLWLTSPAGWLQKNRDQLRNPTLGNWVWATFTFYSCSNDDQRSHRCSHLTNNTEFISCMHACPATLYIMLTMFHKSTRLNCPFPRGNPGPLPNMQLVGHIWVDNANIIATSSAILAQLTLTTNTQTCRTTTTTTTTI